MAYGLVEVKRMIDEKKLIDVLLNNYLVKNDGTWNDAMDRAVELTKKAPKVNEWISVEERLPEEDGTYLCYEVCGNYPNYGVLNFAKNLHKVDKYDFQNKKRPGFYHFDSEYGYIEDTNVVAWQPLPAPYMRKKVNE